jgi:hypothetical protein
LTTFPQAGEGTGATAAAAAEKAADLVADVVEQIKKTPAKTFAGLAVKARALRYAMGVRPEGELPGEPQDYQETAMNLFVSEVERLANAERPSEQRP